VVSRYDLSDGLWLWLELVPVSVSVLVLILYSYHIFILNLIFSMEAPAQVLGATLFQKSYLRNNLKAVLESSLAHLQEHYSGLFDMDQAACELSNFVDWSNLDDRGRPRMNDILVIPCLSRLERATVTTLL